MTGIRKPVDGEPFRRMLVEHRLGYRELHRLMVMWWFENDGPMAVPSLADLESWLRAELWANGTPTDEGSFAAVADMEQLIAARTWATKAIAWRWPDVPAR